MSSRPRRGPAGLFALLLLLLLLATRTAAQFPHPKLQSVYPLGGAAGETVEVQLNGTDLEGVTGLWFDHAGFRAFWIKGTTFRVAIAPGTPPGRHEVRASGPLGVSNPRVYVVSDLPEAREFEPNNAPEQANPIARNGVMHGRSDSSPDVDCFAFDGKRGERVFLELEGFRLDSHLDGVLRLYDPEGVEIAVGHDELTIDPFLDVSLPSDGRYVVKVADVTYNGSVDHAYRLTLRDRPRLDAISPVVATAGRTTNFVLLGRRLEGAASSGLEIGGRPLESKTIDLTFQAGNVTSSLAPSGGYVPSQATSRLGWEFQPDRGLPPLFVAAATDPVVLEHEPNDPAHPQSITLPCDVSGTFGVAEDLDVYRFPARKGETWIIEATAERLGSPADPSFVLQRVDEKGAIEDLAAGDDLPDPSPTFPLASSSVDASYRWQVPADGVYQVAVADQYASQRGDPRLFYRLNIRPPRPDFRLAIMTPTASLDDLPGGLTLRAGGRAAALIVATRIDGLAGPIRVEATNLPPGISCDRAIVGPGQNLAPLVFTADERALPCEFVPLVVGRSLAADRKETLDDPASTPGRAMTEIERAVTPVTLVWPSSKDANGATISNVRAAHGYVVAVREGAPFRLTAKPAEAVLGPGDTLDLGVEVVRRAGFDEAVQVTTTDLPPGLPSATVMIAKATTTATLKLTVPKEVPPGTYSFLLRGTGPFPFHKDPTAKEKPKITVTEPSNPVLLRVRRP